MCKAQKHCDSVPWDPRQRDHTNEQQHQPVSLHLKFRLSTWGVSMYMCLCENTSGKTEGFSDYIYRQYLSDLGYEDIRLKNGVY